MSLLISPEDLHCPLAVRGEYVIPPPPEPPELEPLDADADAEGEGFAEEAALAVVAAELELLA